VGDACVNELGGDSTSSPRPPALAGPALNEVRRRADNAGMFRTGWLLVAALCLAPASAHATAGFAERHTELAYNDLATAHWIHPGDGCDCGSTCLQLVRRNDRFARFAGLECSLRQLSVPATAGQTLVMAQCCADGAWIVYDLAREQVLVRTPDRAEALARWTALGMAPPRLADATRGAHGLHPTWASRFEEGAYLALMWLPVVLPLLFVLGLVRFVTELRRYLATRRMIHLMWCGVLLLPPLSVAWFVVRLVLGARLGLGR
jgi:hypothetical protein